jgi:hypothetical protein
LQLYRDDLSKNKISYKQIQFDNFELPENFLNKSWDKLYFDIKGKKQLATLEKYYTVDVGLLNVLVGRERTADRGHILENIVYLELLRRGYKVWTGRLRNAEVDFTVKKSGRRNRILSSFLGNIK